MLLHIPGVLNAEQLTTIRQLLEHGRFVDGRLSAGMEASQVKHNEELAGDAPMVQQLNQIVMGNLVQHPLYQGAALPHRVAAPFYARYTPGMGYGDHIDDPVMGQGDRYRTDLSISVFLNGPGEYEGGELVIRTGFGDQAVKLPAGDAVMYPSGSLHQVAEVSRGERLVAVTWVQSLVRDPGQREILFELYQAREQLLRDRPGAEETKRVSRTYINLVRMWAEL
ncbi:MAG: Fe2+-dependent dioxygenase [Gammaproteobacteria bacterium]